MPILPPDEEQAPDKDHPMWEYLNDGYGYSAPKRGEIREGTILRVEPDQIIVDVGAKRDAIVPEQDLDRLSEEEISRLEPGKKIRTYVMNPSGGPDEELLVSINLALEQEDWDRAEAQLESSDIIECEVTGYNKGGLLASFGRLQGFVPASHVVGFYSGGGNRQSRLSQYIGEVMPVKVIEVDRSRRRLVLSNQKAQKQWEEQQRAELIEDLEVGTVRHGTVVGMADFGAFIEIDGATGLAHVSELSWGQVDHPSQVLQVGDEVDVYVLDLDPERNRISLSLKRLQPNPWEDIEQRYYVGDSIQGKVVNVVDFGAFVEAEPGVEGLIHTSEMGDFPGQPDQVLAVGDEVVARIIHLDPENQRMALHLLDILTGEEEPDESEGLEEPVAAEAEELEAEESEAAEEPEEPVVAEAEKPVAEAAEPDQEEPGESEGPDERALLEAEEPVAEIEEPDQEGLEESERPEEPVAAEAEELEVEEPEAAEEPEELVVAEAEKPVAEVGEPEAAEPARATEPVLMTEEVVGETEEEEDEEPVLEPAG